MTIKEHPYYPSTSFNDSRHDPVRLGSRAEPVASKIPDEWITRWSGSIGSELSVLSMTLSAAERQMDLWIQSGSHLPASILFARVESISQAGKMDRLVERG
jgi:hypothetical protein